MSRPKVMDELLVLLYRILGVLDLNLGCRVLKSFMGFLGPS